MKYDKKRIFKIVAFIEVFGLFLLIYDIIAACGSVTSLTRPAAGQGNGTEELTAKIEEEASNVTAEVSEVYRSKSERQGMLEQAEEEIDNEFCGENSNRDHIDQKVTIRDSYMDGQVAAEWVFSDYSVINTDGTLQYDNITDPVTVQAKVTLTFQDMEDIYIFDFVVCPASMGNEEGRKYYIAKSLSDADEADRESISVELPNIIQGLPVTFQRQVNRRGAILMALGLLILILMPLVQQEKESEQEKKRQRQLMADYPRIVSQMSLYISAGVSMQNTIKRMVTEYERRLQSGSKRQLGYEELKLWCNEVNAGKSESQAFSNLGKRCNNPDYKKLSMVLVQNMKKGTKGLASKLEMEEQRAFEKRKAMARTKGEEASTKLLIPMIGMLGIIIVILIFPAFMQMNL